MKISVTQRFFWAIMLAASLAVACLVLATQWNLKRGFLNFIRKTEQVGIARLTDSLQDYFEDHGEWQKLQEDQREWQRLVLDALPREVAKEPGPEEGLQGPRPFQYTDQPSPPLPRPLEERPAKNDMPPHLARQLFERFFLFDGDEKLLIGKSGLSTDQMMLTPLTSSGQTVGFLGYVPIENITDDRHLHFLKEQKLTFIIVAAIIVLLSGLLSLLFARHLVRPLIRLARATHTLTGGDFSCRVPVTGDDELGQLARDFNHLALTLEKNEQARRQWIADISHELRTPLGILRGETEALIDGIRPLNKEALQSLNAESLRLERLVDDLHQLSMADLGALRYRKDDLNLAALLMNLVDIYREDFKRNSLQLNCRCHDDTQGSFFGDAERLRQLFSNLLDNSLKYTDAGGQLDIEMGRLNGGIRISLQDTSPGVDESELERLFDRLYRIESSRNRATGGAGLGLALCRNIVEAHQGHISAQQSQLGGLQIEIVFPFPRARQ